MTFVANVFGFGLRDPGFTLENAAKSRRQDVSGRKLSAEEADVLGAIEVKELIEVL